MKAIIGLDGAGLDVEGEIAPQCDDDSLLRLRDMIADRLLSQGLTCSQIGKVLNLEGASVRVIFHRKRRSTLTRPSLSA